MEEEGLFEKAFRKKNEEFGIATKPVMSKQTANRLGKPLGQATTAKAQYEEAVYKQKLVKLQQKRGATKPSYKSRAMEQEQKLKHRLNEQKYKAKLKHLKTAQRELTKAQIKDAVGDVQRGYAKGKQVARKGIAAGKDFRSKYEQWRAKRKSIYK